jgi:hypothetical protein
LANHTFIGVWGGSAALKRVSWVNPEAWAAYVDSEGTMELEDVSFLQVPTASEASPSSTAKPS